MMLTVRLQPAVLVAGVMALAACSNSAATDASASSTAAGMGGSGGMGGDAAAGGAGGGGGSDVLAPELGTGDHTPGSVVFTEIGTAVDRLKTPRALAFNPRVPDDLWVLNYADESVTIIHSASSASRKSERRKDGYAKHFMAKPAAIAFGADATTFGIPGTFATCGESRNTYDDTAPANDFMGPALWSSDLSIFAKKNPNGLGSHLDMLHNSPNCMGIAHEEANVYWTFDGLSQSISKYDFRKDNGIGNDDHSDGLTYQYVKGQVKFAAGVPSHLAYHSSDRMLYVADSGHGRVAKLDTTSGKKGKSLGTPEPQAGYYRMDGATLVDVVATGTGLTRPSGLVLKDELLYVSDNATGIIAAYSLDGSQLNYLDTGLGPDALAGLAFGPDGRLYFVDMPGNRVVRIDAP